MKNFLKYIKPKVPDDLYKKAQSVILDKNVLDAILIFLIEPHIQHFTDDERKLLVTVITEYKNRKVKPKIYWLAFKQHCKKLFNKIFNT